MEGMVSVRFMLRVLLLAIVIIAAAIPVLAQDSGSEFGPSPEDNPNAFISWPPPVYTLRGQFDIRGSANLPDMTNYFISYRVLDDNLDPLGDEFAPAILPSTAAVLDDVLGTWDTEIVDDGLYEIRLTVNVRGQEPVIDTVGPLRVLNNPPPFAQEEEPPVIVQPPVVVTAEPPVVVQPTVDPTPRVTANRPSVNVRSGDGVEYPAIGFLTQGQTAQIIGISARGTGWYQIRLPTGGIGWISPTVVDVSGNLSGVPAVVPPPIPATATPLPTATPSTQVNLVAGIVVLDPGLPVCSQTFNVGFDVANLGTQASLSSGIVSLVDTRAADGSIQGTTIGGFPILLPGQTFRVNMPLTISTWYNETHRITLVIDQTNSIPETNETDNTRVVEYVLQKGPCP
jgi:hypothetical protein